MSRNDSRTGHTPEVPTIPTPAPPAGINFTVPTQIVHLPTKGEYYPEGNSLHGRDTIEIKYMTAKEEDILASPSLIKEGIVIDRLIESILVDKSIKPQDMILADRNAVILAARITGYGPEMSTSVTCKFCGFVNNHTFNLSNVSLDNVGDHTGLAEKEGTIFSFDLPVSGVRVGIRPLFVSDEKYLDQLEERQNKLNLPPSRLSDALRMIVVSINGDTNEANKNRFIDVMPAQDSRYIRQVYRMVTPRIDTSASITCESCQRESDVEVPFNTDFFWPGE